MKFYNENPTIVPGDRYIWSQTWSCPTTNQKWYKLPKRQGTRQQHTQTHHVCQQKPVKCGKRYSNIEREALGILYGLEKVHHYCFVREVSVKTDHKPLVAIFKKDVAMLLLRIHQYQVRIIYKCGPDLFIVDWLSRQNHKENKDAEIPGMQLNIDAIHTMTNIPIT